MATKVSLENNVLKVNVGGFVYPHNANTCSMGFSGASVVITDSGIPNKPSQPTVHIIAFSDFQDGDGTPINTKDTIITYLSDKVGFSKAGASATTTATDVTNFDNNLSAADDTVQKALETLDELSSGGALTAYKTADESKTNDNTITIDDDLQVEIEANGIYAFELKLIFTGDTSYDMRGTFTAPSGYITNSSGHAWAFSSTSNVKRDISYIIGFDCFGTSSFRIGKVTGIITNGTNAGTFAFNWAQQTSGAVATTIYKGSNLVITKLN